LAGANACGHRIHLRARELRASKPLFVTHQGSD